MMRRTLILFLAGGALALSSASNSLAGDGPEATSKAMVVDYTGKIQDEDARPVSGVFHLEFNLYDGEKAAAPAWQERQYVAVVDGAYTVPLGSHTNLSSNAIPADAFIGVELVGEGELIRDKFTLAKSTSSPTSNAPTTVEVGMSEETRELLEAARDNKQIAFADVAERAVSADSAEVATRLGNLTADELDEKTRLALERLGDHIADPDAHQATGGLRLDGERAVQDRVGGGGGKPYQVNCPPGYVVTGIKGGAGRLVDSIRLICQKLR